MKRGREDEKMLGREGEGGKRNRMVSRVCCIFQVTGRKLRRIKIEVATGPENWYDFVIQ